jgi:hypothetical protein
VTVTLSHSALVDFVLGVAALTAVLTAAVNAILARRYAARQAATPGSWYPQPMTARRRSAAATVTASGGPVVAQLVLLATALSVTATAYFYGPEVLDVRSATLLQLCALAWLLVGVYGVRCFFEAERRSSQRRHLAAAGVACALALLIRYDGWLVTCTLLACVVYGCARRGDPRPEVRAHAIVFSFFPVLALALWLAYVATFGAL